MKSLRPLSLLACLSLLAACQTAAPVPGTGSPSTASSAAPSAQPGASASPQAGSEASASPGSQASASPGGATASPGASAMPSPAPALSPPAGLAGIRFSQASQRFFYAPGESASLQIELLDAAGQVLPGAAPLEWTSSRPQNFSVDADGKVTALLEEGFSEIGVRVAGTELTATHLLSVSKNDSGGGGGGGSSAKPDITVKAVTNLAPTRGIIGSTVVISGEGFTGTRSVRFNGVEAASFTVDNDSQISAIVPVGATDGPVSVVNGGTKKSRQDFDVQRIIYVDADAVGAANGQTWTDAYPDLQSGLADAEAEDDQIWIAAGRYVPGTALTSTFQLKPGVALYGGFAGGETTLEARDIEANKVLLSGDVLNNDDYTTLPGSNRDDNVFTVVTGADNALLDGLTISHGNARYVDAPTQQVNGGGLYSRAPFNRLAHVIFEHNSADEYGGGMALYNGDTVRSSATLDQVSFRENSGNYGAGLSSFGSLTIRDSDFSDNDGDGGGGGLVAWAGTIVMSNTTFRGNTAGRAGCAWIDNVGPTSALDRVTFAGNRGRLGGGGLYVSQSDLVVSNSVFYNNRDELFAGALQSLNSANPQLTNVTFYNNGADTVGTCQSVCALGGPTSSNTPVMKNVLFWQSPTNLDIVPADGVEVATSDPFVDAGNPDGNDGLPRTTDDGLRIDPDASEVINAGTTGSEVPGFDILGLSRVGTPEPGAYEFIPAD